MKIKNIGIVVGASLLTCALVAEAADIFHSQAKHSSQCLDIAGGAMDDGGLLVQWPCSWTANESFRFAQ
jgi:hypothetical protein